MQHNFDKFSTARLWLLVRREMLMLTFWEYSIIFVSPLLFILFMLWPENNLLRASTLKDEFIPLFIIIILPIMIYIGHLGNFYSGVWPPANGLKIISSPVPRGMIPVRITEKFIGEFFCFAVLFPVTILILSSLPFLIFRVDFSIWFKAAVVLFAVCSPLIAFKFLRIAIVEDISLHRHHDVIPFLGEIIEWVFLAGSIFLGIIVYGDVLPLHYIAMAVVAIAVIFWWTTYRIRLKNAKR
ncbi:MAG: hypothetical protein R1F54_08810 [Candidatus Zeuxoniibacter abyssi]|nr:MAG: hypothetical protein R1F54_08810 [Candidatus Persebacteraceae bacterium AB1(2)]